MGVKDTDVAEEGQVAHRDLVRFRQRLVPEICASAEGVHTIRGLSLANAHRVEGPEGVVVVEAGHSAGEGEAIRERVRNLGTQPIRAVCLTHHHYMGGVGTLLRDDPDATIVGHPRIRRNLHRPMRSTLQKAHQRRNGWESGADLPRSGPDGVVAPAPTWRDEKAIREPDCEVLPGEKHTLAGLTVVMEQGCFDTDDGLAFRFLEKDTVIHNLITDQFPNFGSLAGGRYRDPLPWLEAMRALAKDPPEHLLPCHGYPVSGRSAVSERIEVNLKAIEHLYQETLEGLARGWSIARVRQEVHLPKSLADHRHLKPLYGEIGHTVAAFAYGEMGFWDGEIRSLLPLDPDQEAGYLADLAGGAATLLENARRFHAQGTHAWALRLADAAARLQVPGATELRCSILREAARETSAWTMRNTLLSLARADENQKSEVEKCPPF